MQKEILLKALKSRGIPEKIINAFAKIKREDFVSDTLKPKSYQDIALPIGHGQTISQPYTISIMLMLLELNKNQKILEIGSGSGYVLSLINEIAENSKLYGIERIKDLVEKSIKQLENQKNIKIIFSDGSKGLKEEAPFDRILVSAASEKVPQNLVAQLKFGGVLVVPVGNSIIKIKKFSNENKVEEYPGFVFVPLVKN